MREVFYQHFGKSPEQIKEIWREADFSFDANCLLNLYRYSGASSTEFLKVISGRSPRVWLSNQAAEEFFHNRLAEISNQAKSYDKSIKSIDGLIDDLSGKLGHPFLPAGIHSNLVTALTEGKAQLADQRDLHLNKLSDDDVLNELSGIFHGVVGDAFSDEELKGIFEAGLARMDEKVPPGYADYPKIKDAKTLYEKRSNFGDYILWMQLINRSKAEGRPIVFVTDDAKDDWWQKVHGRTIGPRPELLSEFKEKAGNDILIYRSEQFLKYVSTELDEKVSNSTFDEIEAVRLASRAQEKRGVGSREGKPFSKGKQKFQRLLDEIESNLVGIPAEEKLHKNERNHLSMLRMENRVIEFERRRLKMELERLEQRMEEVGEYSDVDEEKVSDLYRRLEALDERGDQLKRSIRALLRLENDD